MFLSYHSNTEAVCLHVFRQTGPPQRVDCLAPKWEIVLNVFRDRIVAYFVELTEN